MRDYMTVPTLYASSAGSDSNDGLTPAQPLRTLGFATNAFYSRIDCAGRQAKIIMASGSVFEESVSAFGQLTGTNLLTYEGADTSVIWRPGAARFQLQMGDNAECGLRNCLLDTTNSPGQRTPIEGHQFGVLDLFEGVQIHSKPGDNNINWDADGRININAGIKLSGSRYKFMELGSGTSANINGDIVSDGAVIDGQMFTVWHLSKVDIQGNVRFINTFYGAGRQWYIAPTGVLRNMSGEAVPGTAGLTDPGGYYLT